jgi:hypothetical protein
MAGFAVTVYAFGIVVAVTIVWLVVQRRRPADLPARLAPVIAAARRRALIAVACALVVFLAVAIAGLSLPGLLGWPIAIAPLVAAAAGMLLYAATPPRDVEVPADRPRTASLSRRSWRTSIPRRWLLAGVEIGAVFVAVIVFCGITASTDDQGRSRAIRFESAMASSESSPYPGWFYGIPALLGLALLITATIVALQRIGAVAAFPDPDDTDADARWRGQSASVVLKLAVGAALFSLGGVTLIGGSAMGSAVLDSTPIVWSVLGSVLLCAGVLFLVLSIVSVTLAALTAFTIGERIGRVPETVR